MFIVASIDYRILGSLAWAIYGAAMVALALVLVPGIGVEIAGSRRWFDLGFTTIQPSEFAKIATLLALSSFVASRGPAMRELGNFVVSLLIVLLPMALVFRQPDLGTSLVYGVIWIAVMALAQTRRRYLARDLARRRQLSFFWPGSFFWPNTSDGAGPSFSTRRPMRAAMAST